MTAARDVASQFIASGVLFYEQDADGGRPPPRPSPAAPPRTRDLRIVALVDGGSASASEIVAGALQDTGRATLVGQTTFGKGTVQQWQELTGEGGAFRLTVARWLTPDQRWIHDVGHRARTSWSSCPPTSPPDPSSTLESSIGRSTIGLRTPALLHSPPCSGSVARERKEVMCSDRQYV